MENHIEKIIDVLQGMTGTNKTVEEFYIKFDVKVRTALKISNNLLLIEVLKN